MFVFQGHIFLTGHLYMISYRVMLVCDLLTAQVYSVSVCHGWIKSDFGSVLLIISLVIV